MSDTPAAAPVSFAEFPAVTTAEWQARLARELKGQDPATLRWPLPDGFALEPFYHREALAALGGAPAPLPHPLVPWLNVPALPVPANADGRAQVDQAVTALARGADGVHFLLTDAAAFDVTYQAAQLPLDQAFVGYTVAHEPDALLARLVVPCPARRCGASCGLRRAPCPREPAWATTARRCGAACIWPWPCPTSGRWP